MEKTSASSLSTRVPQSSVRSAASVPLSWSRTDDVGLSLSSSGDFVKAPPADDEDDGAGSVAAAATAAAAGLAGRLEPGAELEEAMRASWRGARANERRPVARGMRRSGWSKARAPLPLAFSPSSFRGVGTLVPFVYKRLTSSNLPTTLVERGDRG
jgi:hypothetical protein